jgi:transcriptional regulator of met regulon
MTDSDNKTESTLSAADLETIRHISGSPFLCESAMIFNLGMIDDLQGRNDDLQKRNDELQARIGELMGMVGCQRDVIDNLEKVREMADMVINIHREMAALD